MAPRKKALKATPKSRTQRSKQVKPTLKVALKADPPSVKAIKTALNTRKRVAPSSTANARKKVYFTTNQEASPPPPSSATSADVLLLSLSLARETSLEIVDIKLAPTLPVIITLIIFVYLNNEIVF